MKYGLIEIINAIRFFVAPGGNYAELKAPSTIATNYTLRLPSALPTSTQAISCDASGNMTFQPLGSGPSVTSVGLSLPSIFTVSGSPVTSSGTLTAALGNQAAGFIFASPVSGAASPPTFRAIAFTDLSAIVGTAANTLAAGNDSRFHLQNTDSGTTAASFQLDSGNAGVRIKNNAGVLEARNSVDSAYVDLVVKNLTVQGTTTTINSNQVDIADSILTLNSDYTGGTPTENGGLEVQRGTVTNASFIWNEVTDFWSAGLAGSELQISRVFRLAFTNATLTAGILTITHNLGQKYIQIMLSDNVDQLIIPDNVTFTSATQATIDLTTFGTLTGSWNVVAIG